ncbi:MAG: GH116 family glycosyl-hydrolase, partial [Planctomycetota bacterium]
MKTSFLISLLIVAGYCLFSSGTISAGDRVSVEKIEADAPTLESWPVLKRYDQGHIEKIALPLGGIGTGTVCLGGRGDLRDWEIMNRSSKGFVPLSGRSIGPFFALFAGPAGGKSVTRAIEGPIELSGYEESHGSTV